MRGASAHRKPIQLHVIDGNKGKKTKVDRDAHAEAEITMGTVNFSAPEAIKKIPRAYDKWKEVTKIYRESGLQLVTSTDNGVIARYCLLWAEWLDLVDERAQLAHIKLPTEDTAELLAVTHEEYQRARANRLWDIINYFTSLEGRLKLDDKINRKCDAILKIEDRIFLNPAAKVRTLHIARKKQPKDKLGTMGFDV